MRHRLPLTLLILGTALPAFAEESHTASTAEVYACATIDASDERLACYDSAVGRLKSAEEKGEVVTVSRSDVEQVKKDSFGFSIPSLPDFASSVMGNGGEIEELVVPVTDVTTGNGGRFVVTLENGQIWHQTDSKNVFYSKKRGVEAATIKSAAMGSFMGKVDGGRAVRMKRIS